MYRLIVLISVVMLAACGGAGAAPVTRADAILCTAVYRSSVGVPIEREETLRFGDADAQQSLNFADLVLQFRTEMPSAN